MDVGLGHEVVADAARYQILYEIKGAAVALDDRHTEGGELGTGEHRVTGCETSGNVGMRNRLPVVAARRTRLTGLELPLCYGRYSKG